MTKISRNAHRNRDSLKFLFQKSNIEPTLAKIGDAKCLLTPNFMNTSTLSKILL